jgi:tRNA pseudouridine55 synthase
MDGLLVIDKPQGMTSFDVVRRVRQLLRTRRVGHAGTLDPLATGVLPVAVGEATRLLQFIMDDAKSYRATFKLGEITDTQDALGTILERRPLTGFDEQQIPAAARSLVGAIQQIPPMYSALKRDGVPLYRLARQGIEVERSAREVEIRRLEVIDVQLPFVTLEVDCSKGTYVRTLGHDLGLALGTGAHLTALRRLRSGPCVEDDCVSLEDLATRDPAMFLLPPSAALRCYPALEVTEEAARGLRHGIPPAGAAVPVAASCREGEVVSLRHGEGLLAMARYAPSRAKEKRGDFELLRVFSRALSA